MTTHNASIYHCQACGRVEHAELQAPTPQCCGRAMAIAGEETIRDDTAGILTAAKLQEDA